MQAGDPRGFYEVLGLRRTASAEEVRAAFRERAKRYHPDRAGAGGTADGDRFRRLREAFETLRDPQRRMRYDAEGLGTGRWDDGEDADAGAGNSAAAAAATAPEDAKPGAAGGRGGHVRLARELFRGLKRRWRRRDRPGSAVAAAVAAGGTLLLIVLLGLLVLAPMWARLDRQDRLIAELRDRLLQGDGATPERPPARPAPAARAPGAGAVYGAELVFPRGSAEFAAAHGERAAGVVRELRGAIAHLPAGSTWTVLVTGHARRPAETVGGAPGAWQLTVRRLAATADYLARQGVPGGRIAARFQAGPVPGDGAPPPSVPEAIQLTLLCCGGSP